MKTSTSGEKLGLFDGPCTMARAIGIVHVKWLTMVTIHGKRLVFVRAKQGTALGVSRLRAALPCAQRGPGKRA